MIEEEFDWDMYHFLAEKGEISPEELCASLDVPVEEIAASLRRLEEKLLIEIRDGRVRLLSVQEMLFRCRLKHADLGPVYVENGVIRVRPEYREER